MKRGVKAPWSPNYIFSLFIQKAFICTNSVDSWEEKSTPQVNETKVFMIRKTNLGSIPKKGFETINGSYLWDLYATTNDINGVITHFPDTRQINPLDYLNETFLKARESNEVAEPRMK